MRSATHTCAPTPTSTHPTHNSPGHASLPSLELQQATQTTHPRPTLLTMLSALT
eukprot:m.116974 g.116974  ORF g.116974 m.116974 type:complete len:54 (+) comp14476_c1_seq3:143-304(+)